MAVIRLREEIEGAFPNGIPYEPLIEELKPERTEYVQPFDSDYLTSDFAPILNEV